MTKNKHVFFSEKDPEQLELFEAINSSGYNFSNMSRRLWMHLLWGTPLPGNMPQYQQIQSIQQVQRAEPIAKQESKPPVLAPIGQVTKKTITKKEIPEPTALVEEPAEVTVPKKPMDTGMPLLD